MNNEITLVYTYYNNPETLEFQTRTWQSYPEEIKKTLKVIVVDDCSPIPALPILKDQHLNLSLFRVKTDIPWNITGAKNLGANQAETKWIFVSDIDHFFTSTNITRLLQLPLDETRYYNINRARVGDTELDSRNVKYFWPSNNLMLLTKEAFWKAGGFDEDFAGSYGCEGGYFRRCLKAVNIRQTILGGVILNYFCSSKFMLDSKTPNLSRDKVKNRALYIEKKMKRIPQSTDHLRFEWERQI